jgi:hypothetical protein
MQDDILIPKPSFAWFGNMASPEGAIYAIKNLRGESEVRVDIVRQLLSVPGIHIRVQIPAEFAGDLETSEVTQGGPSHPGGERVAPSDAAERREEEEG